MANHNITILNPTAAPVTVGANTVQPGALGHFSLSDATTDAYLWSDAGCVIASSTVKPRVKCAVCAYPHMLGEVIEPAYQGFTPVGG